MKSPPVMPVVSIIYVMSSILKIFLLGGFRSEPPRAIPGGHPYRLFVFLLLHPQKVHGRDQIATRLWPDLEPARGRRALSDALYRLRQAVPDQWFAVQNETLAFTPPAALWVDVWAFAENAAGDDEDRLAAAAALYQGELAPDIEDDWIWLQREQLRNRMTAVLQKLAELAENEQQFAQARRYYRRLAEMDDMNEAAQRGLMRCLAAQDRLDEALAVFQQFQAFLAAELSVPPAAETRRLAQQLQDEWEAQQQKSGTLKTIPFVGRMQERTQLLTLLDEARAGQGGLVVLLGQAGMGKTRLLEFLAQSADWRGWQVAWGRGEEFALPQPYAPLAAALTAVLPRPRVQQLSRLVPPWWMSLLARLIPVFRQQPDLPQVPETAVTGQQLAAALRVLLAGLGQIAPHLLLLDDVQWADPAVWPLLLALQPALAEMAILLVVSGRDDGLQALAPAWEAIRTWEKVGVPVIQIGGLEPQPLAEMARALGRESLSTTALAHLHQMSGGNPLLALSLLETDEPVTAVSQSPLLAVQRKRLAGLDDAALLVLQAAAVLGYRFDYDLWEAVVSGIDVADLPLLAGELERERLLILEEDGYRFHHDTLRACVYQDLPPARRPLIHERALAAYRQLRPGETLALLNHAAQGGDDTAVARYALQAGQEALERFAYEDALAYFSRALAVLPPDSWANRFAALAGRVTTYSLQADQARLQADLARLQAAADHLPDLKLKAEVVWRRAEFAWLYGDQESARQLAEAGLALAQEAGDAAREAACMESLGRIARNRGDYHLARDWVSRAHERFTAVGDRFGQASTLDKLANLAFEMGQSERAITLHQQAAQLFHELGAIPYESRSLSGMALAWKASGAYEKARQTHLQILQIATDFGDKHTLWAQQVLLGNIAFELGDYDTAVTWYTEALSLCWQINNPRDISMTLNNLGEAYREKGEPEPALAYYNQGLNVNREKGYQRGEANSLNGIGLAHLDLGQTGEALAALTAARSLWQSLGERLKLTETIAVIALVSVAQGDLTAAQETIRASLELLKADDHPFWRRRAHAAAYRVRLAAGEADTAVTHLCRAAQAVDEITRKLPPGERAAFWQRVPINRQIQKALAAHSRTSQVHLVAAGVPLGQKLTPPDYIAVTWTISVPTDSLISPEPERRRHVLRRLLAEAAAQGAAPTDDDLATAVGVSRRTVLRDMQILAAEGEAVLTRRRT